MREAKVGVLHYGYRILTWFSDDVFRRLFVNAGWLLGSSGMGAVLGLIAAALSARTLGPEEYGVLALVLAYVSIVGKLVSFQAWQAIIKFGNDVLASGDQEGLRKLLKFGFCLDASSAVLGTGIAIMASGPLVSLLGWDESVRSMIVLYSWLILFSWNGTPTGVLRLFNRFDLLSYTTILGAAGKLIGVGWCVVTGQTLFGFVLVCLIAGVTTQLYLLVASLWVLRKHDVGGFVFVSLHGLRQAFPRVWDYVWTTNLNSTIRMLSRELDLVIIAALTSPAAVGVYKIAKQFAQMVSRLFDPLYQSIYPELTRLWAKRERSGFLSLMRRATFFVGTSAMIGWVGFLLVGRWLIELTVGTAYLDAYLVSSVYILALIIALVTFTFQPAMLALGLPRNSFKVHIISTVLYFVVLFPLVTVFGILGASLAYVAYYLAWASLMLYFLKPLLTASRAVQ